MVSIAIVAILATIGLVVYSGASTSARDAKRKGDIDAIAKALESQKAPGGYVYTSFISNSNFAGAGGIPSDPKGGWAPYCIQVDTTVPPANPSTLTNPAAVNWNSSSTGCPAVNNYANISGYTWPASVTEWRVCALLENGTSSTAGNFYCQSNSQ